MKTLLVLVAVLMASPAWAQERVGPNDTPKWTAPTTNVDSSPLTDLAGYRIYVNGVACPGPGFRFIPSGTSSPAPGTVFVGPKYGDMAITPGPGLYRLSAVDTSSNESGCAVSPPFVFDPSLLDRIAPATPTGLVVR